MLRKNPFPQRALATATSMTTISPRAARRVRSPRNTATPAKHSMRAARTPSAGGTPSALWKYATVPLSPGPPEEAGDLLGPVRDERHAEEHPDNQERPARGRREEQRKIHADTLPDRSRAPLVASHRDCPSLAAHVAPVKNSRRPRVRRSVVGSWRASRRRRRRAQCCPRSRAVHRDATLHVGLGGERGDPDHGPVSSGQGGVKP
jgi:hypothetical protein